MKAVTGIFTAREAAEQAIDRLRDLGIPRDNLNLLMPGATAREVEATAPISDTEGSGVGTALGLVAGGSAGAAIGTLVATALIPGIGPITVVGLAAATLFGLGGAVAGATAGAAIDNAAEQGLPHDEIYVYEDALRKGRAVVIAMARDEKEAVAARTILANAGAESVDAAREQWWVGLRDLEAAQYRGDFIADETSYRLGFQAALDAGRRGRTYLESLEELRNYYPSVYEAESFRQGYERGRQYHHTIIEHHGAQSSL